MNAWLKKEFQYVINYFYFIATDIRFNYWIWNPYMEYECNFRNYC